MPDPLSWLLGADPAIRWQALRDLKGVSERTWLRERRRVVTSGWGARLLARQDETGQWGGGIYTPKWTSTTYTLLLLRDLGLPPRNRQALQSCRLLLDRGFWRDGGFNCWRTRGSWTLSHSETCVTGMVVSMASYFGCDDERVDRMTEHLLEHQMKDGGWNCRCFYGATHSSFHTSISVLEGLHHYQLSGRRLASEARAAQARGREFFLVHRLFRSHRTGRIVKSEMTRFAFPPRWHFDVLRGLDYFQACGAERDPRLQDAIGIVNERRQPDGRWILQNHYRGRVHFDMEKPGAPSRWNTLRALRVLKWWSGQ